jgi:UPF0755 protein
MSWIFRGLVAGFLIIIVAGSAAAFLGYRHYSRLRAERIAELKKQAEDVKVTLIEGWKVSDIALALEKQGLGKADVFIAAAKAAGGAGEIPYVKIPRGQSLEGYLFPDTYRFAKASTPEVIIKKILDNFSARVATLGVKADADRYQIPGYENLNLDGQRGLTFHQVVTLASIIEKESGGSGGQSGAASERKIISGIFYNRLMAGQALESDATVNYVSGKDTPSAANADLKINSPYNTYRYPGLPPGPICNPSLASIDAALHPEVTPYYYFLHKQPSGEPVYSKTFAEHVRNKALYLK